MPKNILFVALPIVPYIVDQSPFPPVVDANVAVCKLLALVLHDTWGPPGRNFQSEYRLACRLKADPAEAMEGIAVFFKVADGAQIEAGILRLKSSLPSQQYCQSYEFACLDQHQQQLRAPLSDWLGGA
jgi:hypothetical protein